MNNGVAFQFRFMGFPVIVEWMHIIFVVLIGFISARGNPQVGVIVGFALFLSVFLHEMGHALACKYFKVPIMELRLVAMGGHVAHGLGIPHPQAFMITLAGPAANLLLIIVSYLLIGVVTNPYLTILCSVLIMWNMILMIFNLFPILPLDGSKLLHRVLYMFYSSSRDGKVVAIKRWKRTPDQITGMVGLYASYLWIGIAILLFVRFGIFALFIPNFAHQRALMEGQARLPL